MAEQKKRVTKPKQGAAEVVVNQPVQPTTETTQPPVETPEVVQVQPVEKKTRPAKQVSNETKYIDLVVAKYLEKGWQVFRCEKGALNDFVAHAGKNCQFVQVITPETVESLRFAGEQRNTFIQNAMSNGSVPVHAKITIDTKKNGDPVINITFENANTKTKVVVAALRKKAESPK